MTYDPRQGSSPYLGMDDSYEDDADSLPVTPSLDRTPLRRTNVPVGRVTSGNTRAQDIPATVRRPSSAPRRGVAPAPSPQETVAAPVLRRPRPAPARVASQELTDAPRQADPYTGVSSPLVRRVHGVLSSCAALALWLLSLLLRVAGIALSVMVVGSAVLADSHRAALVKALNLASDLMPAPILGQFVLETPFGGAFRGDLALAAALLLVADWLCLKYRASLLARREREA